MMMSSDLSADIDIAINGFLARTQLTYRYQNKTSEPIEAIYHFSLPRAACIMGCEVVIAEKTFIATVKSRAQASADYEEAIDNQHRAVQIESLNDGLYAINIGNLDAEECIEIKLMIGSALVAVDSADRFIYRLPTTIYPRYGQSNNAIAPEYNFYANYPFTANVTLTSASAICMTSHEIREIAPAHYQFFGILDKDITFDIMGVDTGFYAGHYNGLDYSLGYACLDSVQKGTDSGPEGELAEEVLILLDRSGSMQGNSIALAREALAELLACLPSHIAFNLISFGSDYRFLFDGAQPLTANNKKRIRQTLSMAHADMGGTEMCRALSAALDSTDKNQFTHLVVISDGNVAFSKEAFAAIELLALKTNTVVHTVGVGETVNDSFLVKLAESLGGLSQLTNPNAELRHALLDLVEVISSPRISLNVKQDTNEQWHNFPPQLYEGLPKLLMSEGDATLLPHSLTPHCHTLTDVWSEVLVKLAVSQHIRSLGHDLAERLAGQAEIVCDYTSLIMVEDCMDSVEDNMQTHVIPQMLQVAQPQDMYYDIPMFLRKSADDEPAPQEVEQPIENLIAAFNAVIWRTALISDTKLLAYGFTHTDISQLKNWAVDFNTSIATVLAVYIDESQRQQPFLLPSRASKRIQKLLSSASDERLSLAMRSYFDFEAMEEEVYGGNISL